MKITSYIQRRSPTWPDFPIDLISRSRIAPWAPLPLRLIVGYGFMEHGFAKLARGPDAFPIILHAIGVPAPYLMGWLTILVEIFGGLAVLLGALVPLASIPMAAVLLVAMFTVHLPYGFSSIKLEAVTAAGAQFGPPGFETDLLYLACLAALVLGGSGPLAIDGLLAKRRDVMGLSMAKRSGAKTDPSAAAVNCAETQYPRPLKLEVRRVPHESENRFLSREAIPEYQVEYSIARQVRHQVGPFAGAGMAAPEHATARGVTLDAVRDQLRTICDQGKSLTI